MARAGRKRKAGKRYPSGKLVQAWDYGCDGVQRRKAIYAMPANDEGKANSDHTFDPIGRAWSAGLLIDIDHDPATMRDAGRNYHALYWRIYGVGSHRDSLAKFMPQGGSPVDRERALESALNRMIASVEGLGRSYRNALDGLTLDPVTPDHGPPWLDRLIWAKRKGDNPQLADKLMMEKANAALAAIC